MDTEALAAKLHLVVGWIDQTLTAHAHLALPVADLGFARLPKFYSANILHRAKVIPVANVPVPPLTEMGLQEFDSFEKGNYSGVTFKDTYFVQEARLADESLHFHELVHVVQWAYLGVERFLFAYAAGLSAHGYRNSPLEAMAYRFQEHFDRNGQPGDVEKAVRAELDKLKF